MNALLALTVLLVAEDGVPLRAAPRAGASVQAQLFRGDWLELRAQEPGFFKVYDHRRERPGYVRASAVRAYEAAPAQAPALRAVVAFLREAAGFESLGIGAAALALRCDPQGTDIGLQAAVGAMAERLAQRASARNNPDPLVAQHRAVAESYGVKFLDVEGPGRLRVCYDGAAFRQVLASATAAPEDRARAALSLTSDACADPQASPLALRAWNEWRLEVLGRVEAPGTRDGALLRLRRAGILASLAYDRARRTDAAGASAAEESAAKELALADPGLLAAEDQPALADAALRVAASRWAMEQPGVISPKRPHLELRARRPGETCAALVADGERRAERCTFGLVWESSVRGRGLSLTVAVQPTASWTELWIFRRAGGAWRAQVLPPSSDGPGVGYGEAAGFSPDGTRVLVVREALVKRKLQRKFEVRRASDLRVLAAADAPERLSHFSRWSAPEWRGRTLALR